MSGLQLIRQHIINLWRLWSKQFRGHPSYMDYSRKHNTNVCPSMSRLLRDFDAISKPFGYFCNLVSQAEQGILLKRCKKKTGSSGSAPVGTLGMAFGLVAEPFWMVLFIFCSGHFPTLSPYYHSPSNKKSEPSEGAEMGRFITSIYTLKVL